MDVYESTHAFRSVAGTLPIACCGVVYKCITKILTSRMKSFIRDVVSLNQSAFVLGRHIQNNILLSQEILHNYHRDEGLPRWAAKVDLRKAYDSVRWEVVEFVLKWIGVPSKFVSWIMTCVSTASYSIMLNGAPYGYFCGKRGIRQGDPMSPSLFVRVMELFTYIMHKSLRAGKYKLHYKWEDPIITYLSFADDLIAFMGGGAETMIVFKNNHRTFRNCSGLEVNINKS